MCVMPIVRSGREVDDLLQGKRYMLQNTTMMMHHPSGVARGQASDINNEVELPPPANYSETAAVVTGGQCQCQHAARWSVVTLQPQP